MSRLNVYGNVSLLLDKLVGIDWLTDKAVISVVCDPNIYDNEQIMITQDNFEKGSEGLNELYFRLRDLRIILSITYEDGIISILPRKTFLKEVAELAQDIIEYIRWGEVTPQLIILVKAGNIDAEVNLTKLRGEDSDSVVYEHTSTPIWKFWKKTSAPTERVIISDIAYSALREDAIILSDFLDIKELWKRLCEAGK